MTTDTDDEFTERINEVHPATAQKPRHDLYALAVRMVGNRHSKYALVDLVHWLLVENDKLQCGLVQLSQDP